MISFVAREHDVARVSHLLLLQLDVAATPLHRWPWITDGETGHIDVHSPRHQ